MRYEVRLNPLEPIYHARTAAELMLHDLNMDDLVSARAHAAMRAAYNAVPQTGENFEIRNLMASISTAATGTLNGSKEARTSVVTRCISIIEEARKICE
jgi:hypothetical protein